MSSTPLTVRCEDVPPDAHLASGPPDRFLVVPVFKGCFGRESLKLPGRFPEEIRAFLALRWEESRARSLLDVVSTYPDAPERACEQLQGVLEEWRQTGGKGQPAWVGAVRANAPRRSDPLLDELARANPCPLLATWEVIRRFSVASAWRVQVTSHDEGLRLTLGMQCFGKALSLPLIRSDVLPAALTVLSDKERAGAFRELAVSAGWSALAVLEDGVHVVGEDRGHDVSAGLNPKALAGLLGHDDAAVRARAVRALGRPRGACGPNAGRGREVRRAG